MYVRWCVCAQLWSSQTLLYSWGQDLNVYCMTTLHTADVLPPWIRYKILMVCAPPPPPLSFLLRPPSFQNLHFCPPIKQDPKYSPVQWSLSIIETTSGPKTHSLIIVGWFPYRSIVHTCIVLGHNQVVFIERQWSLRKGSLYCVKIRYFLFLYSLNHELGHLILYVYSMYI